MHQGADQAAAAVHGDVARGPDRRHADVEGEDGIVRRRLADQPCQILRMDRPAAGRADGEIIEALSRRGVAREIVVEVMAIGLGRELRQQRADGLTDIADHADIEPGAAAELARPDVDLRDSDVVRDELLVGKISAEHHQRVAAVHGMIARGEADEAGQADIVGIVVFDMLLAAERMHDRALQRLGELHQFGMRAGTAAAAEQGHALGAIEQRRECSELRLGWPHHRLRRHQADSRRQRPFRRSLQLDIAGNDNHGDTALAGCGADRVFQHERHLRGIGDQLAIDAEFAEQVLRMRLLEIAAADFARWNVRGDCQHRRAAALRVIKTVDQMQIAGTAGAGTHRELARDLRLPRRREGRGLLMPDMHPVDRLAHAQRFGEPVEAVADDAIDSFHARDFKRLDDLVCNGGHERMSPF